VQVENGKGVIHGHDGGNRRITPSLISRCNDDLKLGSAVDMIDLDKFDQPDALLATFGDKASLALVVNVFVVEITELDIGFIRLFEPVVHDYFVVVQFMDKTQIFPLQRAQVKVVWHGINKGLTMDTFYLGRRDRAINPFSKLRGIKFMAQKLVRIVENRKSRPRIAGALAAWALLLANCPVIANPCAYEVFGGRQVFAGAPQPEIHIDKEAIKAVIDLRTYGGKKERPYFDSPGATFTIDYTFANAGSDRDLILGFPIGSVRKDRIVSFSVKDVDTGKEIATLSEGLNAGLPLSAADLQACEKGQFHQKVPAREAAGNSGIVIHQLPVENRIVWYAWKQSFPAVAKTRLRVSYRIESEGDSCIYHYILSTTRHWGSGVIKDLTIAARFKGQTPRSPFFAPSGHPQGFTYDRKSRVMRWRFHDYTPSEDLTLVLRKGC